MSRVIPARLKVSLFLEVWLTWLHKALRGESVPGPRALLRVTLREIHNPENYRLSDGGS